MLAREQIISIAKNTGAQAQFMEKEYLQNIFLFSLSTKARDFIFKGGTALKIVYNYSRFSEDLDFNTKLEPKNIKEVIREILKAFGMLGIEWKFGKEELFEKSYTARIVFRGPLFTGKLLSQNSIRLDIGERIGTVLNPVDVQVFSKFPDIQNYFLRAMDEREILAEKIAAMSSRMNEKDFFDAWNMLQKNVALDKKLLEQKIGKKFQLKKLKFPSEQEYKRLENLVSFLPERKNLIEFLSEKLGRI